MTDPRLHRPVTAEDTSEPVGLASDWESGPYAPGAVAPFSLAHRVQRPGRPVSPGRVLAIMLLLVASVFLGLLSAVSIALLTERPGDLVGWYMTTGMLCLTGVSVWGVIHLGRKA